MWRSLNPRERRLIIGALLVLLAVIAYVMVLEPRYQELSGLRSGLSEKQATLAWMENAVATVNTRGNQTGEDADSANAPLITVIEQSARETGIRDNVNRIQPFGDSSVRIWLDDAAFDDWLSWVAGLGKKGIQVDAASVTRSGENRSNIRVTLSRAGT